MTVMLTKPEAGSFETCVAAHEMGGNRLIKLAESLDYFQRLHALAGQNISSLVFRNPAALGAVSEIGQYGLSAVFDLRQQEGQVPTAAELAESGIGAAIVPGYNTSPIAIEALVQAGIAPILSFEPDHVPGRKLFYASYKPDSVRAFVHRVINLSSELPTGIMLPAEKPDVHRAVNEAIHNQRVKSPDVQSPTIYLDDVRSIRAVARNLPASQIVDFDPNVDPGNAEDVAANIGPKIKRATRLAAKRVVQSGLVVKPRTGFTSEKPIEPELVSNTAYDKEPPIALTAVHEESNDEDLPDERKPVSAYVTAESARRLGVTASMRIDHSVAAEFAGRTGSPMNAMVVSS